MFTGNGITDAVFYHLFNSTRGTSLDDLYPKLKLAIPFLITSSILIGYCVLCKKNKIKKINIEKTNYFFVCSLLIILTMPFSRNISASILHIIKPQGDADRVSAEYKTLNSSLNKKYNYVFIYAESLEKTFEKLNEKNYLPELSKIANDYAQFTNIIQPTNGGFGWTMAGMVNTQCGVPLVMAQGNTGGNAAHFLPKANCVASWLKKIGYRTHFIRGSNKEFAGADKFFSQHGWSRQDDLNFFIENKIAKSDQISGWGVQDDVLLDYAWDKYLNLSNAKQPFLLSLLTVGTHAPDGKTLATCENKIIKEQKIKMLSAVRCSDYLISNFINKLINSDYFDNTIIVLVSDHLMMRNSASQLLDANSSERRNNFIIIKKGLNNYKNDNPGSLIDVWPTVLDISGKKDNSLGFGVSLLSNNESSFYKNLSIDNAYDYIKFSSKLWNTPSLKEGLSKSGDRIQIGKQAYSLPVFAELSNENLGSVWFEGFAKNVIQYTSKGKSFFYANLCKNIGIDSEMICAYHVTPKKITKMLVTPMGLKSVYEKDATSILYKEHIAGISSGPYFIDSGISSTAGKRMATPFGFSFLTKKDDGFNVTLNFETCHNQSLDKDKIKTLLAENHHLIYTSNDSINCGDDKTTNELSSLLSDKNFTNLAFRQQVTGIITGGKSVSVKGLPDMPLDTFIDLQQNTIHPVCEVFLDCPTPSS
ncbi:sulfatase-like hydrolase/transferase [Pantoea allii]|uniref:sulfatase-like hydrolase/transferase n=2 Tax=Pantoea allii TaxID=574096 RepID=UPI003D3239F7